MNYICKHWHGKLSLAVSFWINFVILNFVIRLLWKFCCYNKIIENPVISARVIVVLGVFAFLIVYPWQIIGLWRSCNNHIQKSGRYFWVRASQVLVVLGIILTLGNLNSFWPIYQHCFRIGFEKDNDWGNYTLTLEKDNTLIHLQGGLGLGISKEVAHLLKKYPEVKGIVLDSYGGRIYEGRMLAKLISAYGLDTYSLKGCYSAATTAFIAGKNRFLGMGANIAFHQYRADSKNIEAFAFVDMEKEQARDLLIFQQQGVQREFIEKLFNTPSDDLYYPTVDELLNAGVIHGIVNPSDVIPVEYQVNPNDFNEAFLSDSAFKVIRQYEPETYKKIMAELEEQIKNGATRIEIQHTGASYMKEIATRAMPRTSDEALIRFAKEMVDGLKKLEEKDPFLCLKSLYPQRYGAVNFFEYPSQDEPNMMLDAMDNIIVDAYEKNNPPVDTQAAEVLITELVAQLGDDAQYLDIETQDLQNSEQYKQHCDVVIRYYELILNEDKATAGNVLRYMFSQIENEYK
jgi:hypothetical protein